MSEQQCLGTTGKGTRCTRKVVEGTQYCKTRNEVLDELWHIIIIENQFSYEDRVFAYALAYLLSNNVPSDRTSKRVFSHQQEDERK